MQKISSLVAPAVAFAALISCLAVFGSRPATADDVGGEDVEVAPPLPVGESCDEIAARIAGGDAAARDADLYVAAARCDVRAERYRDAVAHARAARQLAPERRDVDLWEGIAQYHLGELDAARELLARAQVGVDDERALLMLYRGRAALAVARRQEARETLAGNHRSPLRVAAPVDFFKAVDAWPQDLLRGEARRDLEEVARYDESGVLAAQVGEALAGVAEPRRPWIGGGVELAADDNFALLGSFEDTPSEISRKAGFEFAPAITLQGGGELFRAGGWSGGLLAAFYGTFPDETSDLDTVYPTVSAVLDSHISDHLTFRGRYDFGYAWVDGDAFALTNDVGFELHNRSEKWGESLLWSGFYYNIFYDDPEDFPAADGVVDGICDSTLLPPPFPPNAPSCTPPEGTIGAVSGSGSRRDRTGWGFLFGGRHQKAFAWNDTVVRGGYTYQHYIPDGAEFHNQSHGLDLGVNTALAYGFTLDLWASFIYQGSRNVSIYPEPETVLPNQVWQNRNYRRHDRAWEIAVQVERRLFENIRLWTEYRYMNNDSNHGAFEYDRNYIGVGVAAILH